MDTHWFYIQARTPPSHLFREAARVTRNHELCAVTRGAVVTRKMIKVLLARSQLMKLNVRVKYNSNYWNMMGIVGYIHHRIAFITSFENNSLINLRCIVRRIYIDTHL